MRLSKLKRMACDVATDMLMSDSVFLKNRLGQEFVRICYPSLVNREIDKEKIRIPSPEICFRKEYILTVDYAVEFQEFVSSIVFEPAGIFNTAGLLLWSLVRFYKPEIMIESGTGRGYSSQILAGALSRNRNGAILKCLSLFEESARGVAARHLQKYPFSEILEGNSAELIDSLVLSHATRGAAFFIDGPKAKSADWALLMKKIDANFKNVLFITFDACQEHIPAGMNPGKRYHKGHFNMERAKVIDIYESTFRKKGYQLLIQSNQFCERYEFLNDEMYKSTITEKKPYYFSSANQIGHSFKLGVIYKPVKILE